MPGFLEYYARKDIQKAILSSSLNREAAVKYSNGGFGKRPDVLQFESDVFELAKSGATSFHISEEHWRNPLLLKPGMTKNELDKLRTGFDVILDIDTKFIEYSKATAELLISALRHYNIKNIGLKFSGGNGFHIGIPFSSLPQEVNGKDIKLLFPEVPRAVATYIKEMINLSLRNKVLEISTIQEISQSTGKTRDELMGKICRKCNLEVKETKIILSKCQSCHMLQSDISSHICSQCGGQMLRENEKIIRQCPHCGTKSKIDFKDGEFNPFSIIEIDTILISNRHMYRAPCSINEKRGLVSLPIDVDELSSFNINKARIENIKKPVPFLPETKETEAASLVIQSLDEINKRPTIIIPEEDKKTASREYDELKTSIPDKFFPPCISSLLQGVKEDGRKRALFILLNFLRSAGYPIAEVERMIKDWNKRNTVPLGESYVVSQLNWHKKQNDIVLPPNCSNENYYKDLGVKCPDEICSSCKNPINYTKRRFFAELRNKLKLSPKSSQN